MSNKITKEEVLDGIDMSELFSQEDKRRKLIHELFLGKIVDEIGADKTFKLIEESTKAIDLMLEKLKNK